MSKQSFTPLSKHALGLPFMDLELGCQRFIKNYCTEFLRNLTGGVVAATGHWQKDGYAVNIRHYFLYIRTA